MLALSDLTSEDGGLGLAGVLFKVNSSGSEGDDVDDLWESSARRFLASARCCCFFSVRACRAAFLSADFEGLFSVGVL